MTSLPFSRPENITNHSATVHGLKRYLFAGPKGAKQMRRLILSAACIVTGLFATGVNAMPAGKHSAPDTSLIQKVDYACGRGYHLSPRGFCRPNRPPPGYYGGWDRRDRWEERREWRERQARREWRDRHDRRNWHDRRGWHGEPDYRW